ncbi:MAG: hypothetical protein RH948_06520 [Cyclobacteriaceae bacterium]
MKSALKRLITGQSFNQEYLCLAKELRYPLEAFLIVGGSDPLNVTAIHRFVGYKPLVIAIGFELSRYINHTKVCLCFTNKDFEANDEWMGFQVDSKSVAKLLLIKKETKRIGDTEIVFYQGCYGHHHFLPWYNQVLNSILLKFKKKVIGNISLNGNLYDQVRIAYAIPRKIALISVADNGLMNMFPTDLHGMINDSIYISSLRIGGEACKQVERIRKIVISDIESLHYQEVYSMGKNHMRQMKPIQEFDISDEYSDLFKFPLPKRTSHYRELEIASTFDLGIHRVFLYKIVNEKSIKIIFPLFHIHNYYGQWRKNNKLPGDYLLRVSNASSVR